MYRLYGRIGSGSAAVEAVLALAGAPHEVVWLGATAEGRLPEDIAAVNPMRQVPALVLPDGDVMAESAAILLHLAETFPETRLAPPPGDPRRPRFLRWMIFLAANVYMTELRFFYPERYSLPAHATDVRSAAADQLAQLWRIFADALGNGPFMLGEDMTIVDLYAAMLLSWNHGREGLVEAHPSLAQLCRRVASTPEVAEIWRRHDMPV